MKITLLGVIAFVAVGALVLSLAFEIRKEVASEGSRKTGLKPPDGPPRMPDSQ
jgi:hypothetical protein